MVRLFRFFKVHIDEFAILMVAFSFYLIAINTQIGWLFMLTAAVLGVVIISFYLAGAFLKQLTAERILPPAVFEGENIKFSLRLVNSSRKAGYLLLLKDSLALQLLGEEKELLVSELKAGERLILNYQGKPVLRGVYPGGELWLESGYPFGFFPRRKKLPQPGELVVYPSAPRLSLSGLSGEELNFSLPTGKKYFPGRSFDFLGIREHQPGEDTRFIHWKSSAKKGELMVKEFTTPSYSPYGVIIHNFKKLCAGKGKQNLLEYGIKAATALMESLLSRGSGVSLFVLDQKELKYLNSPSRFKGLDFLARILANGELNLAETLKKAAAVLPDQQNLLLITPEPVSREALKLLRGGRGRRKVYVLLLPAFSFSREERELKSLPELSLYRQSSQELKQQGIACRMLTAGDDLRSTLERLLGS